MIYTIKNENLEVSIEDLGGQMCSIKDTKGREYLWQRDEKYWGDSAINLFPYIARLTQGKYTYRGKTYEMDIHGFLKDSVLKVKDKTADKIVFSLRDSEETYRQYPFHFELKLKYQLQGKELKVTYSVKNKDRKKMYFGIGGHPGFLLPWEEGLSFEDYDIAFASSENMMRVGMSEDCFVIGKDEAFSLDEQKRLHLRHDLFDHDAIILRNVPTRLRLEAEKGSVGLEMETKGLPYLGIWHMPHTDAPYVCIEPWSSLPSRKDVIEDLETQENLQILQPKGYYSGFFKLKLQETSESR